MKIFVYCLLLIFMLSSVALFSQESKKSRASGLKTVPNKIQVRLYPNSSTDEFLNKLAQNSLITINKTILKKEESVTYNQKLKKEVSQSKNLNIENIIKAEEPLLRTFVLDYQGISTPEKFAVNIKKQYPEIEIAEPIFVNKMNVYFPDDPLAAQQGLLHTCDLLAAWDIEQGDTNVVIAISDIGCDQSHEDLKDNIARNWADPVNGIDDDGNGYIDDFNGIDLSGENKPPSNTYSSNDHGTNVAGIASATHNNGLGIAGVSYKSRFFPIKISKDSELVNAYDSFIYAGKRKFKVMNCSWGIEKIYSDIEQTMINYAVANDVAIVASGGNKTGSVLKNYPAAYSNVLSVGEVNQADIFSGNNIGESIDILAPGEGNFYPTNGNNYSSGGSGSSYSAPVVSGILALVRSKYPELTPLQASELVRQSVIRIDNNSHNLLWKGLLPGRVNAYKAVTTEPFSIPSIRPLKVNFKAKSGQLSERISLGDSCYIEIDAYNYLGEYDSISIKMTTVWDDNKSVIVLDSMAYIGKVEQDKALTLSGFSFKKVNEYNEKMFFRFDISGANGYQDFFIVDYIPTKVVTNFSNQSIAFSASDRGTIGIGGEESNVQGIGFQYKDKGNFLWRSAFFASEMMESLVTALGWDSRFGDLNDFAVVKPLLQPNRNIGIFNDSKASVSSRIGFEVKQEFIVPEGYHTIAKINIEVTNTSSPNIPDFSSGYFFDWDVKNSDSNTVSLVLDAVPEHLANYPSAVQMVQYSGGNYPVVGCGVISFESNAKVQSAGLDAFIHDLYDDDVALAVMKSGTTIQDFGISDMGIFVGMLFEGNLKQNETKKYSICFGGADTPEDFVKQMKLALDSTYTPVAELPAFSNELRVYPNPVSDILYCELISNDASNIEIKIVDILGNVILQETRILHNPGKILMPFDLSEFPSGNYIITAKINNEILTKQLNIIR